MRLANEEPPAKVQSVTEFTRAVKSILETSLPAGWVRGEVSNVRAQSSGHWYFSLKDAGAQVSAVLFRGDALRQSVQLRDGLQVVVYGQISVYEARGNYQLIVRAVVEDGVGRLQREFEALKQRLAAEGLFAPENKVPLPRLPATVGFITSPTGAAVQDFIRILQRREWRGRLVILPAKVQGEGAAREMADLISYAEGLGVFDLLVIGRGGGSLEDLWAFNEEVLIRAVSKSSIPIISAVGHEIDFTLCDFAADARAETPSGAAELISSHFLTCCQRLEAATEKTERLLRQAFDQARQRLKHSSGRLRLLSPSAQIERGYLRIDDAQNRLRHALERALTLRRQALTRSVHRLARIQPARRVEFESHRLLSLWKRLQAASPQSVLNRGFAWVHDASGKPIERAKNVPSGAPLSIEFADGSIKVRSE